MMDSRPQSGHRHATANAVVFANAPDKETVSTSNCTIPFGLPPYRKHHALPTTATITKKRDRDRPNGTSDPQEQDETKTAQLASAEINERAAPPPEPALARRRFRFAALS